MQSTPDHDVAPAARNSLHTLVRRGGGCQAIQRCAGGSSGAVQTIASRAHSAELPRPATRPCSKTPATHSATGCDIFKSHLEPAATDPPGWLQNSQTGALSTRYHNCLDTQSDTRRPYQRVAETASRSAPPSTRNYCRFNPALCAGSKSGRACLGQARYLPCPASAGSRRIPSMEHRKGRAPQQPIGYGMGPSRGSDQEFKEISCSIKFAEVSAG